MSNYTKEDLPKSSKENEAEKKLLGRNPRSDVNIVWNEMIMSLGERDRGKFLKKSRELLSLISVFDNSEIIKKKIGASRYCVYQGRITTAENFLFQVKKLLERNRVHIVPTMVG